MASAAAREGGASPALPDGATRTLITLASLFAVMMVTIDGTIAIIALPRIQSSLAASQEQIAWVLTSYLVAGAIATPLSGWLADRYGRTKVMAVSVLTFTIASLGCASGLIMLPLMLVVFSTLPNHLRNQGSTLFALIRSVAGAGGISVIQAMTIREAAAVQSRLVENIRPDNPLVAMGGHDLESTAAAAGMIGQVMRQAQMVAYVDNYQAIFLLALVMTPLCLLLRANPDDEARPVTMHSGE